MSEPMKKRPTNKGVEIVVKGEFFRVPKTKANEILKIVKPYKEERESYTPDEVFSDFYKETGGKAATLLRGARLKAELTQKQLSEITGIDQGNISQMEKGKRSIG